MLARSTKPRETIQAKDLERKGEFHYEYSCMTMFKVFVKSKYAYLSDRGDLQHGWRWLEDVWAHQESPNRPFCTLSTSSKGTCEGVSRIISLSMLSQIRSLRSLRWLRKKQFFLFRLFSQIVESVCENKSAISCQETIGWMSFPHNYDTLVAFLSISESTMWWLRKMTNLWTRLLRSLSTSPKTNQPSRVLVGIYNLHY